MTAITGYANRFSRLDAYERAVERELPAWLPRFWSVSRTDALTLGRFLDLYARETIVLDIGTFVGISAFWFAVQPNVVRVVSVDPNPRIADEVLDKEDVNRDFQADYDSLKDIRVLDVTRAAMRPFDERRKVWLCEGVIGTDQVGIHGAFMSNVQKVKLPEIEFADDVSLVAFVDGLHTAEGVYADLREIYAASPGAIAFLHDCRTVWGPSVREGVEALIRSSDEAYNFELLDPPAPFLGDPNLGIVYPGERAAEVGRVIERMRSPVELARWTVGYELTSPLQFADFVVSPRILQRGVHEAGAIMKRMVSRAWMTSGERKGTSQ